MKTEILIIGAGPSGLVASLLLSKLGISNIVIERNSTISTHPKAHELNARSIEILKEVGIGIEELKAEASDKEESSKILFCNTINEELGRIDLFADTLRAEKYATHLQASCPFLNLSQTELEKILLQHVEKSNATLLFNYQWISLEQNENGVLNTINETVTQQEIQIESKYVIAADGSGSRCRKQLGILMNGPEKIQDFVNAYFEINLKKYLNTTAKLYWIFNPKAAGTFVCHHSEKRWIYNVPVISPFEKPENFTKEYMENRIKDALGNHHIPIHVKSISVWRMTAQIAEKYNKEKVVLVGDAAHRFPPTGGLGMNTGIADVHNICWKLKYIIKNAANESLLDSYEKERKPIAIQNCEESRLNYLKVFDILKVIGLEFKNAELLAKTKIFLIKYIPSFIAQFILNCIYYIANLMVHIKSKNRQVQKKLQKTIDNQINHFDRLGLDIGYVYHSNAIIENKNQLSSINNDIYNYDPSVQAGARMPHFWLNKNLSTHDLFSYNYFTLMILDKEVEWKEAVLQINNKLNSTIQIVNISTMSDSNLLNNFMSTCKLNTQNALLIRPDGHIAWNENISTNFYESLFTVIQKILIK